MTTTALDSNSIPRAAELENVGDTRQNQILNVMLATITAEPTCWTKISKAVGDAVKIRKNGWGTVRNLLQWLIDNHFVARVPFNPKTLVSDTFVRLPR